MLTTIVAVLQLVRGASSLGCYGFEAYSECGEPQKEFRMESGDQPCDAATMSAGYCVCTSSEFHPSFPLSHSLLFIASVVEVPLTSY